MASSLFPWLEETIKVRQRRDLETLRNPLLRTEVHVASRADVEKSGPNLTFYCAAKRPEKKSPIAFNSSIGRTVSVMPDINLNWGPGGWQKTEHLRSSVTEWDLFQEPPDCEHTWRSIFHRNRGISSIRQMWPPQGGAGWAFSPPARRRIHRPTTYMWVPATVWYSDEWEISRVDIDSPFCLSNWPFSRFVQDYELSWCL